LPGVRNKTSPNKNRPHPNNKAQIKAPDDPPSQNLTLDTVLSLIEYKTFQHKHFSRK